MSEAAARLPAPALLGTAPVQVRAAAGLVLLAVLAVSATLWQHWSGNADLSHGLLMPLLFAYLIHEARSHGVLRYTKASPQRFLAQAALGLLTLVLGLGACLYATALGWGQALAAGFAGASLSALLLLANLSLSDHRLRLLPLNWQSLCAALLWVLTVPMPPGAYTRLSGSLQEGISQAVLLALNLLGIPATRQGNIIELAHGRVGVEEACSGVRSLIACIFAALLISALVLRTPWRRALLILCAPVLALLMNLLRSLLLTLLANAGIDIDGAWHDGTGFAILGLTALLLFLLAQRLEANSQPTARHQQGTSASPPSGSPNEAASDADEGPHPAVQAPRQERSEECSAGTHATIPLLLATSSCAAILGAGMLLLHWLPRSAKNPVIPVLEQAIPSQVPGWELGGKAELQRFAKVLHTEHLLERSFTQGSGRTRTQVTIYAAAWEAGAATPAEISLHTPEVCWPGAGWTQVGGSKAQTNRTGAGQTLSFRSPEGELHQVVYWLLYDGEMVPRLDPYSPPDLLRLALRYGYRAPAPQLFVRVSGNRPQAELLQLAPVRQALHALGISDLSTQP